MVSRIKATEGLGHARQLFQLRELVSGELVGFVRLLNLKIITQDSFRDTERGRYLTTDAFRRFVEEFEKELSKKPLNEQPTLKASIESQVLSIKRRALHGSPIEFYRWE